MSGSEVARLMRQIELEYEAAARGMYGFAEGAARHAFIAQRYRAMERCQEHMAQLVGPEQARQLAYEAYCKASDALMPFREQADE